MRRLLLLGLSAAALGGLVVVGGQLVTAADHAEAPGVGLDPAADIGDFYAWETASGNIAAILTYSPFMAPATAAVYDADLLYGIHIDNDGDVATEEHDVWIRFGQNGAGDWGVEVTGIPGATAAMVGPVGESWTEGGMSVFAGLTDDPFFFDQAGFLSTIDANNSDGSVDFSGFGGTPVDALAGLNVMSIAVEFPASAVENGTNAINLWASTARIN